MVTTQESHVNKILEKFNINNYKSLILQLRHVMSVVRICALNFRRMRPNEIERSLKPSVPNGLHSTQYLSTGIHVMLIPRLLRIEHWFAMKRIMRYLDSTSSYTFGTRAPTYLWMSWYSDVDLCDT